MPKRIEYIDIARGIGILLVVLGHNENLEKISFFTHQLIYSFHIPLFFFLSGYLLNVSVPFFEFFKKRFHSLLKPYFFTIFIFYFISVSFGTMGFWTAIQRIIKSLYGTGYYLEWIQLWFLPHLFVVNLYAFLFFTIFGRWNNRFIRWTALVVTLGISSLFLTDFYPFSLSMFGKSYVLQGLPFSLDLVLLSGFFFILGSEIRQATSERIFENVYLLMGAGIVMVLTNLFLSPLVNFNTRMYESYWINTIEAIAGILFVLTLSRQIELRTQRLASLLTYLGQISLFILIFHFPIQDGWRNKVFSMTNNELLSIGVGFVMSVAGSALIYELFIKTNPVALWGFGHKTEIPKKTESSILGTMDNN